MDLRSFLEAKVIPEINLKLAEQFRKLGKLEPIYFKKLAYNNAAITLTNLERPITSIEDPTEIHGIGTGIAKKIKEFIQSGQIKKVIKLESKQVKPKVARVPRAEILQRINRFVKMAKKEKIRFEICGSVRRQEPTIKDIDILALKRDIPTWQKVVKKTAEKIVAQGPDQIDFIVDGVSVNIRAVKASEWGAGLLFLTGSSFFSIRLRDQAKKKGMLLNRYGLWTRDKKVKLAGRTEQEIFKKIGVAFVPPERRG